MWLDDKNQWTQLNTYTKTSKHSLKIDVSGEFVLRHVNLLIQKTTADNDDNYIDSPDFYCYFWAYPFLLFSFFLFFLQFLVVVSVR